MNNFINRIIDVFQHQISQISSYFFFRLNIIILISSIFI